MFKEEIIPLSADVFRLIGDLIKNYCGICFDDKSKYIFERRLSKRLVLHHMKDFREYYRFLKYDAKRDDEFIAIVDILTVNETYFFRAKSQLAAFSKEIIPELMERNKKTKKIRIWSAGCSTGEEPYTLAMFLLENENLREWDVNVLGSDISQRVLQVARRGIYKENSFRVTDEYFIEKYFHKEPGDNYRISDRVKAFVNFNCLNLFDPFKLKFIEQMDVIFCRNVLIYFDQSARKRVTESFFDILTEGSYLLIGYAESLMNISAAFTLKHLKNDMVYQKPIKSRSKFLKYREL